MPTVTFLDADVLINAFRGKGDIATAAQAVLDDPDRTFLASDIGVWQRFVGNWAITTRLRQDGTSGCHAVWSELP